MKLFLHTQRKRPWGTKIKRLAAMAVDMGCAIESIDYTDTMNPRLRVDRLLEDLVTAENNN